MRACAAAFVLACLGVPLSAQSVAQTYRCERSVELPVVYVSGDGRTDVAVLLVEGVLVNLGATPAASGVRYAGPPKRSGYVWRTKGEAAFLTWFDAAAGQETPVYTDCEQLPD